MRRVRGVGWMLACGGKVVPPPPRLTSGLPCRTTGKNPHPICSPLHRPHDQIHPQGKHKPPPLKTTWLSGGCARCLVEKSLFRPQPKYSRSTKRGYGLRHNHSKHCWPTSKHWHWASMQHKGLPRHRFSSSLKIQVLTFCIFLFRGPSEDCEIIFIHMMSLIIRFDYDSFFRESKWYVFMPDCERLRRAGPLMSPSINLQHALQSKHRHSVIVKKPQHTAPYINTLFSQPCQNKGCKGKKK